MEPVPQKGDDPELPNDQAGPEKSPGAADDQHPRLKESEGREPPLEAIRPPSLDLHHSGILLWRDLSSVVLMAILMTTGSACIFIEDHALAKFQLLAAEFAHSP